MGYDVEIQEIQPRPIAVARATVRPTEIGVALTRALLPRVYQFLTAHSLTPSGPPIAIYHEFGASQVVLEGGVPVNAAFSGAGDVRSSELPGGRVAVTRHIGPYHELGAAHDAIRAWLAERGLTAVRPIWEIYPMPPGGEPDSAKLVTEVYWLLSD